MKDKKEIIVMDNPKVAQAGFLDSLFKATNGKRDVRDQAYCDMVKTLFDDAKLLYISRLDRGEIQFIIKNLIVIDFYQEYFSECKVTYWIEQTDTPPFYIQKHDTKRPDKKEIRKRVQSRFSVLIDKILKLSISKGGLGRNEILKLLDATKVELEEKSKLMGLLNR